MSADFWMGMAIGSIVVILLILVIIFGANRANEKAARSRGSEANFLLRTRNEIGESQCGAIQEISMAAVKIIQWGGAYLLDQRTNKAAYRRERIATQALQGYLAGRASSTVAIRDENDTHHQQVAAACCRYADSLTAELDRKENDHDV